MKSDTDDGSQAEIDHAIKWFLEISEGKICHDIGTLRVWDGEQDHVRILPFAFDDTLELQLKVGKYLLDQFRGRARIAAYSLREDSIAVQLCGGWSKVTMYRQGKTFSARIGDSGDIGRFLWTAEKQLNWYTSVAGRCRDYATHLAATWTAGHHDSPVLHASGHRIGGGRLMDWESFLLVDACVSSLRELVVALDPEIICLAAEGYVQDTDGNRTGEELFTLTFETPAVQHPIFFVWGIRGDSLVNRDTGGKEPIIRMNDGNCSQLMRNGDFR